MKHLTITTAALRTLSKEIKTNNLKHEYLNDFRTQLLLEDSPKGRMAIQMTRERYGRHCLLIKEPSEKTT